MPDFLILIAIPAVAVSRAAGIVRQAEGHQEAARIRSAARSAIMMVGALVLRL